MLPYTSFRTWVADAGVGVYPVLAPLGVAGHTCITRTVIDVLSAVSASEPRGTVAGVVRQEVLSDIRGRKCVTEGVLTFDAVEQDYAGFCCDLYLGCPDYRSWEGDCSSRCARNIKMNRSYSHAHISRREFAILKHFTGL